jgi:hypothetical protein
MEDFTRNINYHVRKDENGEILLAAEMSDHFHDIRMEVRADIGSLTILSARVNFVRHPSEDCPDVAVQMERLIGLTIGRGLSRKLRELFGGGAGCGNLRLMLQGLLPLAINVRAAVGFSDEQEMLDSIKQRLTGSCAGYIKRPE